MEASKQLNKFPKFWVFSYWLMVFLCLGTIMTSGNDVNHDASDMVSYRTNPMNCNVTVINPPAEVDDTTQILDYGD